MSETMSVLEAFDTEMTANTGTDETPTPETTDAEAPDAAAPEPVEGADPEPAPTDGIPRDEQGRFAPKATPETTTDAATTVVPEVVPPQPFQYRAMGETRAWEGATVQPDGSVVIPADKVGDLRQALNAKHLAEGEYVPLIDRYKQEVQELRQRAETRTLEQVKYETMSQQLTGMLMERDLESALVKFMEMHDAFPQMMSRAEVEYWKTQANQGRAPETAQGPPPTTYPMPAPEAALSVTLDTMEHLKLDPTFKDLTADDWKQLEASHKRTPLAFLRPATAEESAQYGGQIAVGQPVFDEAAYQQYVTEWAQMKRHGSRVATKAQEAAQFNAGVAKAKTPAKTAPLPATPSPVVPEHVPGPKKLNDFFRRDFMRDDDD